jgi:hypothetical protein
MHLYARLAAGLAIGLGLTAASPVEAATTVKVGGAVNHVKIWIPEYYGGVLYADTFDYTVTPAKFTRKLMSFKARQCNPNSVAVNGGKLYVVCNSDFGGKDQVLVYNATTYGYIKTITGVGTDNNNYFAGSSLIGSVFDTHGNLWLSGYNSNDLLRISAAQLAQTTSLVDRQVVDSPDQPAGLAIDSADGSFWVVGQFAKGIALNFADSVLNQAGTFLGDSALNPSPDYCISDSAGPGCQNVAGLFNAPEGVAVFDGGVWVSNNGGNAPTGTIVELKKTATAGQLSSTVFGTTIGKPFSCPGGMFSTGVSGQMPTLWVNDEGYGIAGTDCGSSGADQGNQLGRVLEFLPNDLLKHRAQPVPHAFTNAPNLKTASPGFGGIFVQMD